MGKSDNSIEFIEKALDIISKIKGENSKEYGLTKV